MSPTLPNILNEQFTAGHDMLRDFKLKTKENTQMVLCDAKIRIDDLTNPSDFSSFIIRWWRLVLFLH